MEVEKIFTHAVCHQPSQQERVAWVVVSAGLSYYVAQRILGQQLKPADRRSFASTCRRSYRVLHDEEVVSAASSIDRVWALSTLSRGQLRILLRDRPLLAKEDRNKSWAGCIPLRSRSASFEGVKAQVRRVMAVIKDRWLFTSISEISSQQFARIREEVRANPELIRMWLAVKPEYADTGPRLKDLSKAHTLAFYYALLQAKDHQNDSGGLPPESVEHLERSFVYWMLAENLNPSPDLMQRYLTPTERRVVLLSHFIRQSAKQPSLEKVHSLVTQLGKERQLNWALPELVRFLDEDFKLQLLAKTEKADPLLRVEISKQLRRVEEISI